MADVIDRITTRLIRSVNTPDYPEANYIRLADKTTAVAERTRIEAIPRRYRKIVGDTVRERTRTEKDAVDAANETTRRLQVATEQEWRSPDGSVWLIGVDDAGDRTKRKLA